MKICTRKRSMTGRIHEPLRIYHDASDKNRARVVQRSNPFLSCCTGLQDAALMQTIPLAYHVSVFPVYLREHEPLPSVHLSRSISLFFSISFFFAFVMQAAHSRSEFIFIAKKSPSRCVFYFFCFFDRSAWAILGKL